MKISISGQSRERYSDVMISRSTEDMEDTERGRFSLLFPMISVLIVF